MVCAQNSQRQIKPFSATDEKYKRGAGKGRARPAFTFRRLFHYDTSESGQNREANKPMTILITGGTGFIGVGLAHKLVARGEKVVLFDVAPRTERVREIRDRVKVVRGDLSVWPEVMNAVKENQVDGIFHLGSMLSGPSDDNPWSAFQINVAGAMHVLEAARLFEVSRFVFPSSIGTYGLNAGEAVDDETIQRPVTFYGAGKLYVELLVRFYARKFGLDFRCLRFPIVIGPGVKTRFSLHYSSLMIENAALGKPYECTLSEDVVTPTLYVKDAVRAVDTLYYAPRERIKTMCYNVCGISPAGPARELESAVRKVVPEARISYRPDPADMEYFQEYFRGIKEFDDRRAREEWGWQPEYTDYEKIAADFVQEVRTRADYYGLT